MRVTELIAFHVKIPLQRRIKHASHTRTDSENVIVACRLEDGTTGFGEGVPREYVTGETIDGALALLRRSNLAAFFADHACSTFPDAVAMAESLRLAPLPGDTRQCQGNAARCALELAVLDAYGRHFRQPVSAATKLLAPELHEFHKKVQYSGAITSAKGFKACVAAWRMRIYGFRHCKIKVGIAGYDDVRRMARIRRNIGWSMNVRVDANEAWSPAEVADRIIELQPFQITAVEQPVPHEQVTCLGEIRRIVSTPIMHDESLCSMVDAEAAVRDQTCDLFNLRLSKCGGFIPSLRLAQFAQRHGLGYQLGCQVGETSLLSAAGRHFAASVRDIRFLEGSYDRRLVKEPLSRRDITFGYGGWAPALTSPGLGVEVDEDALQRVTIRKEVLIG